MTYRLFLLLVIGCGLFPCCQEGAPANGSIAAQSPAVPVYKKIGEIPLPAGCQRMKQPAGSFGAWLRGVGLKPDKTVYLYNGQQKRNQLAQFAVLDIPVGDRDLQQCADAIMRLYAEYLYSLGRYEQISFTATDGSAMDYSSWMKGYRFSERANRLQRRLSGPSCEGRACFENYLQAVYMYAGTLSLSASLQGVADIDSIMPGYVFIRGGSPGHAVLVVDVAYEEATGKRLFLLAQSYMPAQDIHVLQNPSSRDLSPWYTVSFGQKLYTPEWIFKKEELKKFR